MKFSVLIPTRNRLQYLKYAIETVIRQNYIDWEIVISDNASQDDIWGYVRSINDQRIKYYRTKTVLPVTDNWNNALNNSSGEYIIMLGDDDALVQGYFFIVSRLIKEFQHPDCIYTGSYHYAYPGVIPGYPSGYLRCDSNPIASNKEPFFLDNKEAFRLVHASMNFRMLFPYNMQHSIISRALVNSLKDKGQFFQSPYPDFYATNVIFLKAKHILVYQRPLVIIGLTPKSYGFFHFNNKESQGGVFLKNEPDAGSATCLSQVVLPGSRNNTSWLLAMEMIKQNFIGEKILNVNYNRYRRLQIWSVFKKYYLDKKIPKQDFIQLQNDMSLLEKLIYNMSLPLFFFLLSFFPGRLLDKIILYLRRLIGQYTKPYDSEEDVDYDSILKVVDNKS